MLLTAGTVAWQVNSTTSCSCTQGAEWAGKGRVARACMGKSRTDMTTTHLAVVEVLQQAVVASLRSGGGISRAAPTEITTTCLLASSIRSPSALDTGHGKPHAGPRLGLRRGACTKRTSACNTQHDMRLSTQVMIFECCAAGDSAWLYLGPNRDPTVQDQLTCRRPLQHASPCRCLWGSTAPCTPPAQCISRQ